VGRPANIDPWARHRHVVLGLIETFKTYGYDGATLTDLAVATGLAKPSLYHRFPAGKPDMARAALAESGRRFTDLVLRPLRSRAPALERLNAMAEGLDSYYARGAPGCLMNSLTLGSGQLLFGPAIAATIAAWTDLMAAAFVDLGRDPQIATERAREIVAKVQGALVIARITAQPVALKALVLG
jgi:TetR/AcrR family transcriptional regulator, lmrAB and yxaGH operons repressor